MGGGSMDGWMVSVVNEYENDGDTYFQILSLKEKFSLGKWENTSTMYFKN